MIGWVVAAGYLEQCDMTIDDVMKTLNRRASKHPQSEKSSRFSLLHRCNIEFF